MRATKYLSIFILLMGGIFFIGSAVKAAPIISEVTSTNSNGYYGVGQNVNVTINFSEPVYTVGDVTIGLNSGRSCTFSIPSGSPVNTASCVYVVQSGDQSGGLNVSLVAGNIFGVGDFALTNFSPAVNIWPGKSLIIDGIKPELLFIMSSKADGSYGVGEQIPIILDYSEPVTTTDYADISLNSGDNVLCRFEAVGTATTTPTCIYTVAEGENTSDLDVLGVVATGANFHLYDLAGNELTVFSPQNSFAADYDIVIDTIVPQAVLSGVPSTVTSDNSFSIGVSGGFDFYKYKLNDGDWSESFSSSVVISLNDLALGTYSLKVIGGDLVGNWQPIASATSASWIITSRNAGGAGGVFIAPAAPATTAVQPQVLGVKVYDSPPGVLVKTKDNTAIYYISEDGKRHLYVNEAVYWTWHKGDWASQDIKIISQAEFDGMPEGEHATARAGEKLVKFSNSPRIYEVLEGAFVNYLPEDEALLSYGGKWQEKVIVIQSGFENDYTKS